MGTLHTATFKPLHTVSYRQQGQVIATWNADTREITADGQVIVTGVSDDYTAAIEVRDFFDNPAPITEQADSDYLVTCPHDCDLGTSALAPDRATAEKRVQLHKLATDTAMHQAMSQAQVIPTHVVVDTEDGYTWSHGHDGRPFTEQTAREYAEQFNAARKPQHRTGRVFALVEVTE